MASLKTTAILAARKSGALLMRHYGKKIGGIRKKKGTSLVTALDLASNDIILKEIKKRFPTHNIITEESSPINHHSEYTWHIDPIDGTHNFIRGLPLFGVSIGLAKGNGVVLGVIYLPAFGKMYVAERGKGAFCNGKRLLVSKTRDIDFSFILFDSSTSTRRKKLKFMHAIATRLFNERVLGCAVYACCMVAEGRSDALVFFKTNSWDVAAGFLLIEEAGGRITTFQGERWMLNQKDYVATNGRLQGQILASLRKSGAD